MTKEGGLRPVNVRFQLWPDAPNTCSRIFFFIRLYTDKPERFPERAGKLSCKVPLCLTLSTSKRRFIYPVKKMNIEGLCYECCCTVSPFAIYTQIAQLYLPVTSE